MARTHEAAIARSGDIELPVPVIRQQNWASCGLAAINMCMRYLGLVITEKGLAANRLVRPEFLRRHGFGPGRLGRIALSYSFDVTIIDADPRDVGSLFVREGGRWIPRDPNRRDIETALREGVPVTACIPDKSEAFENCTHRGSHWVVVRGIADGEFLIHDPAPWRKATRCKPGYWDSWACSMIVVRKARARSRM
jgi:hypothetical protein